MDSNKVQSKYKYPTCRGSYAFGTACGHCEKCQEDIQYFKAVLRGEEHLPNVTNTKRPSQSQPTGWVCPVCGSGLAPSTSRCSCVQPNTPPPGITYVTVY